MINELSRIFFQSLGYQGEIGYQTFLYSSVKDWRKLLMFLLEKLSSKDTAQTTDETMGLQFLFTLASGHILNMTFSFPGGGRVMPQSATSCC